MGFGLLAPSARGIGHLRQEWWPIVQTAVFLGAEPLLMTRAGISAILAGGVEVPVGGTVAVIVNALLPVDPEQRMKQGARPIFDELAAALEERNDLSTTPLVAQVRSTVVDRLGGTAMDYQAALRGPKPGAQEVRAAAGSRAGSMFRIDCTSLCDWLTVGGIAVGSP